MGKRNQSKKWIRVLLTASVLGSMGAFPVMAENVDDWISGSHTYDYINYISREPEDFPEILLSGASITLTGLTDRQDYELFTYSENPHRYMRIKLAESQLHISGDPNTTYKITGKIFFAPTTWEMDTGRPQSAIHVDSGTLCMDNLYILLPPYDPNTQAQKYTLTGNLIIDNLNSKELFYIGDDTQAAHISIKNQIAKQYDYINYPDPEDPNFNDPNNLSRNRDDIGIYSTVFLHSDGTTQETSTEVAVGTKARAPADYGPYNGDTGFGGNDNGNIILTNAKWQVGKNATLIFGTENYTVAREVFKKTGLTWGTDHANGEVNAIVYVEKPVNFWGASAYERGGLYVDPNWTEKGDYFQFDDEEWSRQITDRKVYFKNGSLLMIKGSAVEGDKPAAFLNVNADIRLEDDVNLFILDAEVGKKYNIFHGAAVQDGFTPNPNIHEIPPKTTVKKIITNNPLIKFDDNVKFEEIVENQDPNYEAVNIRLYSVRAVPDTSNPLVTDFGELAGVTHGLYTNALLSSDLAQDHLSIAKHDTEMHKDLWAAYVHNRESVNGLALSKTKADYEGSYNNLIVGSDLYAKDNLVIGAAANYTTGKISSRNSTTYTKNDAKYYGASIYGRKINGKTAYLADISYLRGENDITQRVENSFIKGKPKTKAFTMGVKAEQAIEKSYGKLIPYAGVRYMHLDAEGYTTSLNVSYDPQGQDLLLLPFGVKYTTEKEMGNWKVKPMAEVGVVINTGDKGTKQTVSFEEDHETVGYEVVDGTSLIGKIGVQAEKKNMTIGASYQYQKSSHTSNNRIHLDLSYKF